MDILNKRVEEFDRIEGMSSLPITAVLSNNAIGGSPFTGKVNRFLKAAIKRYGTRFVYTMNIYPQFSRGLAKAGCHLAARVGTKFTMDHPSGFTPAVVKELRKKLNQLGAPTTKIWIGESGWATRAYCALGCGEACRNSYFQQRYYEGFLSWDLSASEKKLACGPAAGKCAEAIQWAKSTGVMEHPEWYPGLTSQSPDEQFQIHLARTPESGVRCPFPCGFEDHDSGGIEADHMFYFMLRDSVVFGKTEDFGLISKCGSSKCKFQKSISRQHDAEPLAPQVMQSSPYDSEQLAPQVTQSSPYAAATAMDVERKENEHLITVYHQTSPQICELIMQGGFKKGHGGWCGDAIYFAFSPKSTKTKAITKGSHDGCMIEAKVDPGHMYKSRKKRGAVD